MIRSSRKLKYAELTASGVELLNAALQAGYAEKSLRQQVWRLEKDSSVHELRQQFQSEYGKQPSTSFEDPEDFFRYVMNDGGQDMPLRMQAAKDLLAYTKIPVSRGGKKAAEAQAAESAAKTGNKFSPQAPPKLTRIK